MSESERAKKQSFEGSISELEKRRLEQIARRPKRYPGEPPESFDFERHRFVDVLAWNKVCPNFYVRNADKSFSAYSKKRYGLVSDLEHQRVLPARRKIFSESGQRIDPPDNETTFDPEDTDEIRQLYEHWRQRYKAQGRDRLCMDGESVHTFEFAKDVSMEWKGR